MADNTWLWSVALRPIGLIVLLSMVYPFRILVQRKMKEGKWKRLLLRRVGS